MWNLAFLFTIKHGGAASDRSPQYVRSSRITEFSWDHVFKTRGDMKAFGEGTQDTVEWKSSKTFERRRRVLLLVFLLWNPFILLLS